MCPRVSIVRREMWIPRVSGLSVTRVKMAVTIAPSELISRRSAMSTTPNEAGLERALLMAAAFRFPFGGRLFGVDVAPSRVVATF